MVLAVKIFPSVEEEIQSANANIKPDKLYGKWKVSILEADNPVDLNNDGSASTNIIQETNCFNTMGVVFDEDRNFTTTNAQMDFTAGTENMDFACMDARTDSGTWELQRDQLTLNLNVNGMTFSQTKTIKVQGNSFSFRITKAESNQYVNDPGNTKASEIRILEVVYTKA